VLWDLSVRTCPRSPGKPKIMHLLKSSMFIRSFLFFRSTGSQGVHVIKHFFLCRWRRGKEGCPFASGFCRDCICEKCHESKHTGGTVRCAIPTIPLNIRLAGNTKGGSITVTLTSCLVWNQLYDNWQLLFLSAKQTNPNQSNRRSVVQWYFPFSIPWG